MRVGIVCPYDWSVPGGVGNHARHLAAELRRRGYHADVLAPASRSVTEPGVIPLGRPVAVPYNGSVARIAIGPRAYARVRAALARGRYDLVHVHEPLSPSVGLLAVLAASAPRARVPLVGTFHANLERSRALDLAVPLLRRAWARLDARVAVSQAARDTWQGRFGGSVTIVPNGVPTELFEQRAEPLPGFRGDGHPTVLFVGRVEPRKGLAYLVRAYLRLKGAFPGLRVLVVGRDDTGQQEKLLARVPARLRPDLVFLGAVPQQDLPACFAAADVFCAPSLGGESFGIVLVEAMAMGLPVVCSDISGYRDLVRDGREGVLVPPRDAEALATALGALLDNPARRAALGESARASARRYGWDVVGGEVLAVYERALAGGEGE